MSKNTNDFEAILLEDIEVDEESVKKFKEEMKKK